jgi:hypothetical protein
VGQCSGLENNWGPQRSFLCLCFDLGATLIITHNVPLCSVGKEYDNAL